MCGKASAAVARGARAQGRLRGAAVYAVQNMCSKAICVVKRVQLWRAAAWCCYMCSTKYVW